MRTTLRWTTEVLDPLVEAEGRASLVQACQAGDVDAFRLVYRRHVEKVRSLLFRLVEPQNIDDLTQEVFVKVWKHLPKLETPAYLSTWIYRITTNVANDHHRLRRRAVPTEDLASALELPAPEHQASLGTKEMIAAGLAQLSFDHRTVIVLFEIEGLTVEEIASVIQKPIGTVKSRLAHARSYLLKAFEAWEGYNYEK